MKTVAQVFRERLRGLAVGTDGSALALTLAFLVPVYFLALGLYAVVETAHRKIELQNAADAAAYSAATVQADYLSRIATINKCLAWTYADLIRRQMDLAQAAFATEVVGRFEKDQAKVVSKHNEGCERPHCSVPGLNYNAGSSPNLLKKMWKFTLAFGGSVGLPQLLEAFNDQKFFRRFAFVIAVQLGIAAVKGKGVVVNTARIIGHQRTIRAAHKSLDRMVDEGEMREAIMRAATNVIDINTREIDEKIFRYVEVGDPRKYLRTLGSGITGAVQKEADERNLLEMGFYLDKDDEYKPKTFFGKGADYWYCRSSLPIGLFRVYQQKEKHLYAQWSWFWTRWGPHVLFLCAPPLWRFDFSGRNKSRNERYEVVRGTDIPIIENNLPIGLVSLPVRARKLCNPAESLLPGNANYFGEAGTTVVGLARENRNPLDVFGKSVNGIVKAFGDGKTDGSARPKWIFATSAARAGYNPNRYKDAAARRTALKDGRFQKYQLAFLPAKGKNNWNLNQTDWIPMLVPVAKADASCVAARKEAPGAFMGGGKVLHRMMTSTGGWEMREKGKWRKVKQKEFDPSKLEPPKDDGFKGKALDWGTLAKYMRH